MRNGQRSREDVADRAWREFSSNRRPRPGQGQGQRQGQEQRPWQRPESATGFGVRNHGSIRHRSRGPPGPADFASIGVPGLTLCRNDHPVSWRSSHNVIPGSPGERDEVCSPGYEAGRRRAIGVVAALAINQRTTAPMVRRGAAKGATRKAGVEAAAGFSDRGYRTARRSVRSEIAFSPGEVDQSRGQLRGSQGA